MKRAFWSLPTLAFAFVVLLGGCSKSFQEGFNVGFCKSYKESFDKACVDECAKKAERSFCESSCDKALKDEKTFSTRCKDTPTGKAVYGTMSRGE
jgi:hypothetical protein